jgi:hypothetical protein
VIRAAATGVILLLSSPALACHHFQRWAYQTPQLCDARGVWHGAAVQTTALRIAPPKADVPTTALQPAVPEEKSVNQIPAVATPGKLDFPVPDVPMPDPDPDRAAGLAKLRAILK